MNDIWPRDVLASVTRSPDNRLRGFRCLILMPFKGARYDQLAEIVKSVVTGAADAIGKHFHFADPVIERLDWVLTGGAIQNQIWTKIVEADLVVVDLTGHNPNVMFEAGVCAAVKDVEQVIFLKDLAYPLEPPFDVAPFRYLGYELTSEGLPKLRARLAGQLEAALLRFPDSESDEAGTERETRLDFSANVDDLRVYTPPFAHRRVRGGALEFGSLWSFPHSWATVGPKRIDRFELEFTAAFAGPVLPNSGYIGVGVRSQHYYAQFAHIFYLNRDGSVVLTQPNEEQPDMFRSVRLREAQPLSQEVHRFRVLWDGTRLTVEVDDLKHSCLIADMAKVLGPGCIRLQSHKSWMGLRDLRLVVE